MILIDSSIEIAFKEYLVNESGQYYNDKALSEIFKTKNKLFSEMRKFISLDDFEWKQLGYYADVRNKIIHQRATVGISASDIESFRGLAARILDKLFGLRVDV